MHRLATIHTLQTDRRIDGKQSHMSNFVQLL